VDGASGNRQLWDILLALCWVYNNAQARSMLSN